MNKKPKQATSSLFDEHRRKHYPKYSFKWEQVNGCVEIDPARFIHEGVLYEAVKTHRKPHHYILTLDMLISSPIAQLTDDIAGNLQTASRSYCLRLMNPKLYKVAHEGVHGVRLVSDGLAQILFCRSKDDMERWFGALKRVSVLENIEGSYELRQYVGSGSSAVVKIGREVGGSGKTYAVKSFQKRNYTERIYSFVSDYFDQLENFA
eukprot:TRINITY_DN14351_c0_g1_i1.p2 TRINITY_DN14351_c0_g1~~TRINITY_DN14351_c0_g1_i1.p2  ORF type:complete len:207 (-),score=34.90 TRINITY_DN14351_c0_g1_i1:1332-1952(-)